MNKHTYPIRVLSMLVCLLMLIGSMSLVTFADETGDLTPLALDKNLLAADKYSVYNELYKDAPMGASGIEPLIIDSIDDVYLGGTSALIADENEYTAEPEKISKISEVMPVTLTGVDENNVAYPEGTMVDGVLQTQTGLYLPAELSEINGTDETCYVSFKVDIPATGRYAIQIEYYPIVGYNDEGVESSGSGIERTLYIDGVVPFYEARFLTFNRVYSDKINSEDREDCFEKDIAENELRPKKIQTPRWMKAYFTDSTGSYTEPFRFYLEEGTRVLTLASQRESFVLSKISVIPYEGDISYEDYLKANGGENVSADDIEDGAIKLEAELYTNSSDRSIYPMADHSSAITSPQNASRELLNIISEDNWKTLGQWASWTVTVPKTGYYKIGMRYRQSTNDGLFSSRILRIDGEIPFDEARFLQFDYSDEWQSCYLNDGSEEHADGFLIYLEEGTHTIALEASLGNMSEVIRELTEVISIINTSYIEILKITGNTPDANRDYGFYGLIPDHIDDLADMSVKLYEIAEELTAISGKSSNLTTLENVARRLDKMGNKEDEVAKNMSGLKSDIGSLGTWLQTAMTQPLTVDYLTVQSGDSGEKELPQATEGFLESMWYEIRMFGMSFISDYNTLGVTKEVSEEDSIIVWTSSGRDQAKIIRNLINGFSEEYEIAVSLKLTAAGSLLPSILAGVGPDVSLDSVDIIDWAIRGAIVPLGDVGDLDNIDTKFEGFKELYTSGEFPRSAFVPLTLYTDDIKGFTQEEYYKEDGSNGIEDYSAVVYGLPMTMDFPMMFYREDIFQEMGLTIPDTWDDFYNILPILQNNQMQVVFPTSQGGTTLFLYQMMDMEPDPVSQNGLYADNGRRVNLDSDLALTAFDSLCNLFTQYKLPVAPNFENQFRTGDIPLGITAYSVYTQLSVFAPEIRGLWKFVPIPGWQVQDDDGNYVYEPAVDSAGNPIYEQKLDEYGKPLFDEEGNAVYLQQTDEYGEPIFEDGQPVYKQAQSPVINNNAVATVTCIVMPRGNRSEEKAQNAFTFMAWYVGYENQANYANEYSAWMGQQTKYNTANIKALYDMNWTTEEMTNIRAQMENLITVPDYPGSYIITRNVNNAFMNSYNNNADPVTTMLDYIVDMNKEISRKRSEFNLDALEISYTNTFTESKK